MASTPLTVEQALTLLEELPQRIAALTAGLAPAQLQAQPDDDDQTHRRDIHHGGDDEGDERHLLVRDATAHRLPQADSTPVINAAEARHHYPLSEHALKSSGGITSATDPREDLPVLALRPARPQPGQRDRQPEGGALARDRVDCQRAVVGSGYPAGDVEAEAKAA